MTSRTRRAVTAVLTSLLSAGAAFVGAADARAAAPVFQANGRPPVVGDLTGDGIADRLTIGTYDTPTRKGCGYQLRPGLGAGRFGAAVTGRLPVRNDQPDSFFFCPTYTSLLKGPTPTANRLAVTWFDFGPAEAPWVQTFGGFGATVRFTGGFDGPYQTGQPGSRDFDGDGWGDLWVTSSQGSGFEAWVGRGSSWHRLYATPVLTGSAQPQFVNLNHNGGTDIVDTWDGFGDDPGVAVVDGLTGAQQLLTARNPDVAAYEASLVDIDHNSRLDLQVRGLGFGDGQVVSTQRFVNESSGGRWYFRALPAT